MGCLSARRLAEVRKPLASPTVIFLIGLDVDPLPAEFRCRQAERAGAAERFDDQIAGVRVLADQKLAQIIGLLEHVIGFPCDVALKHSCGRANDEALKR